MSSASTGDLRGSIRRSQQRRQQTPQLSHSSSMYGLSSQATTGPSTQQQQQQPLTTTTTTQQQVVAQPAETRTLDPTFEPLERSGRAINDSIRKDDRFPELDQLVQRISAVGRGC